MYEPRDKWMGRGGRFRRRGIYWLPNLFTTIALFAGFFSIVQAMNGRFEQSALAIFIALVFDGLDGRVARFTHTQSAFGAEYDSLADMVSFGVAPALVIYVWALKDFSSAQNIPLLGAWLTTKLGWIAAFIYCACSSRLPTNATSRGCRARPQRAWSRAWYGRSTNTRSAAPK